MKQNWKWWLSLILICLVLAACQNNNNESGNVTDNQAEEEVTNEEEAAMEQEELLRQQFEESLAASYGIVQGQTYAMPVTVILHEQPAAATSSSYMHELEEGELVTVVHAQQDMVQVQSGEKNGWVSAWLLSEEANDIKDVEPYEMIVGTEVIFSMYPGQETPYGFELTAGKVVQVHREFGDWVDVRYISGESAFLDQHWVPKSSLVPYDPELAKDGLVKPGSEHWEEFKFGVWVTGETETELEVEGPGGASGTIAKEDFIPNPFVMPTLSIVYVPPMSDSPSWKIIGFEGEAAILKQAERAREDNFVDGGTAISEEKRSFDELIQQVSPLSSYPLQFYLQYEDIGVQLSFTEEFKQRLESDDGLRLKLNDMMSGPLQQIPLDLVLTPEYVLEYGE